MARNIVLISIDSLRADYCGEERFEKSPTPALDEMAENGVSFENAIAPGHATPISMPAIFTGTLPVLRSTTSHIHNRETIQDHMAAHLTVPEYLSQLGYSTGGVTPNPFTSSLFGFGQGFDHFEDFLDSSGSIGQLRSRIVSRWAQNRFVAGLRFGLNMIGWGDSSMPWEAYYDTVLKYADELPEPFFLWVFLLDPHWPYRPPQKYRDGRSTLDMYYQNWQASNLSSGDPGASGTEALRELYHGTVRYTDEFIANLTRDLGEYDPAFVVHADHGEAFGEHNQFGHGPFLYEENIHVPFVIGNVADTLKIEWPMSLLGLPCILNAVTTSGTIDWESFRMPWASAHTWRGDYIIRGHDWKYYAHEDGDISFYNLSRDPSEEYPLNDVPEALSALCDCLDIHYQRDYSERTTIAQTAQEIQAKNHI